MNSLAGAPGKGAGAHHGQKHRGGLLAPTIRFLSAYSDFESQRVRKMFFGFSSKPEILGDTTSLDTYQ